MLNIKQLDLETTEFMKSQYSYLSEAKSKYRPEHYRVEAQKVINEVKAHKAKTFDSVNKRKKEVDELVKLGQKKPAVRPEHPESTPANLAALTHARQRIESRLAREGDTPEKFLAIIDEIIDAVDSKNIKKNVTGNADVPHYDEPVMMKWALVDMYPSIKQLAEDLVGKAPNTDPQNPRHLQEARDAYFKGNAGEEDGATFNSPTNVNLWASRIQKEIKGRLNAAYESFATDSQVDSNAVDQNVLKSLNDESAALTSFVIRKELSYDNLIKQITDELTGNDPSGDYTARVGGVGSYTGR